MKIEKYKFKQWEKNILSIVKYIMLSQMNCRVNNPATCKPVSLNKWEVGGSQITENGVTMYNHGMIISKPGDGLTVYQRRSFIEPEYYNSGCSSLYCQDRLSCPEGKLSMPTKQENEMFDYFFASTDPFITNNEMPRSCAGINEGNINSYSGWMVPPNQTTPVWMLNAQKNGNVGTCAPAGNNNMM